MSVKYNEPTVFKELRHYMCNMSGAATNEMIFIVS